MNYRIRVAGATVVEQENGLALSPITTYIQGMPYNKLRIGTVCTFSREDTNYKYYTIPATEKADGASAINLPGVGSLHDAVEFRWIMNSDGSFGLLSDMSYTFSQNPTVRGTATYSDITYNELESGDIEITGFTEPGGSGASVIQNTWYNANTYYDAAQLKTFVASKFTSSVGGNLTSFTWESPYLWNSRYSYTIPSDTISIRKSTGAVLNIAGYGYGIYFNHTKTWE